LQKIQIFSFEVLAKCLKRLASRFPWTFDQTLKQNRQREVICNLKILYFLKAMHLVINMD
jgi:hypothetical protein